MNKTCLLSSLCLSQLLHSIQKSMTYPELLPHVDTQLIVIMAEAPQMAWHPLPTENSRHTRNNLPQTPPVLPLWPRNTNQKIEVRHPGTNLKKVDPQNSGRSGQHQHHLTLCRTTDLYLETKVGGRKERPQLNLTVKGRLKGKNMAQSRMVKICPTKLYSCKENERNKPYFAKHWDNSPHS